MGVSLNTLKQTKNIQVWKKTIQWLFVYKLKYLPVLINCTGNFFVFVLFIQTLYGICQTNVFKLYVSKKYVISALIIKFGNSIGVIKI